tara:strand:+ start:1374 stop:1502 length:129 start_codon:yes stop_codon:yes gene_type:complete
MALSACLRGVGAEVDFHPDPDGVGLRVFEVFREIVIVLEPEA